MEVTAGHQRLETAIIESLQLATEMVTGMGMGMGMGMP
jgi:hypothetical protein